VLKVDVGYYTETWTIPTRCIGDRYDMQVCYS